MNYPELKKIKASKVIIEYFIERNDNRLFDTKNIEFEKEKKIDELREIYQTIIEDTKFEDDVSVQYFLSKEIDIEDEIYDLIQERERLQREITSHVD